jgi:hypothetical protein
MQDHERIDASGLGDLAERVVVIEARKRLGVGAFEQRLADELELAVGRRVA